MAIRWGVGEDMNINVRYIKDKDLFELQIIEPRLRSHFLLSRPELNNLRTLLEKALLESKTGKGKRKPDDEY